MKQDYSDAATITHFLAERNPLILSDDLFSLETGEVADSVTIYDAKQIGEQILRGMVDVSVLQYSYKKKDMAIIMKSQSNITVDDEVIHVDLQLLFQRLLATPKGGNVLRLEELSTVPASLYGEAFYTREANKPQLGDAILKFAGPGRESLPEDISFVIDSGWLLYRIPNWRKATTFESICQFYKEFVILHYGRNTTVVFDGGYE